MDFARSAFGVRCVLAPLLGSKVERSPRRLLKRWLAWMRPLPPSCPCAQWSGFLPAPSAIGHRPRKLSRAGSRPTFLQRYTEPGSSAFAKATAGEATPATAIHRITTSFYSGGVGRGCGVGRGLGVALGVALGVGVTVGVPVGVGLTVAVGVGVGVGP